VWADTYFRIIFALAAIANAIFLVRKLVTGTVSLAGGRTFPPHRRPRDDGRRTIVAAPGVGVMLILLIPSLTVTTL